MIGGQLMFQLGERSPAAPDAESVRVGQRDLPVHVFRSERARRYLLSLRSDFTVRLVIPRRGSLVEGRRFLERKTGWLERQLRKLEARPVAPKSWGAGTLVLLGGREEILVLEESMARLGAERIPVRGDEVDLRPWVQGWLQNKARRELPAAVAAQAEKHRIDYLKVTVRDQSTRWGSCSSKGTISLNWRLIQVPTEVRDYLIIHELMHRREMNHGPRYWRLVEEACPDYREHERWLKMNGARLGL